MDWRIKGCRIAQDGQLHVSLGLMPGAAWPEPGDVIQVGQEIPPIPGLRGNYVVASCEFDAARLIAEIRLSRASRENIEQAQQKRIEGISQTLGPNPNWAEVWDRLDFLPQHRRSTALRMIQQEHRDDLESEERNRRVEELARQRAEQIEQQKHEHDQQIEQRASEIKNERAFAKYTSPKHRKIDLDDDQ